MKQLLTLVAVFLLACSPQVSQNDDRSLHYDSAALEQNINQASATIDSVERDVRHLDALVDSLTQTYGKYDQAIDRVGSITTRLDSINDTLKPLVPKR